ncbi:MAG: hypothetical protein ACLT8V_04445, partial [Streptococcus salivarius]
VTIVIFQLLLFKCKWERPCTMPFPFTFEEEELKNYYSDWELVKYNENLGHLHRLDEYGNPIALQFATMLAKKVK